MQDVKDKLIAEAILNHGEIKPVAHRTNLQDCFTFEKDQILFWFNDGSNSTKIISRLINEN